MDLPGKNCVIVGGFGGIGFETSKELIKQKIGNLVILDKDENATALAELKAIDGNVAVHFWPYDITMKIDSKRQIFKQILAKINKIDVLINAAGICNDHAVELTIQINLIGLINTTTVAFESLDKRHGGPGGTVLNIASVTALSPFPYVPVYSATKAAVLAFGRALSKMQPETGINVITVCPGITKTPILNNMHTYLDFNPSLSEKISQGSTQSPQECGHNIVLAIKQNTNGAVLILDNGVIENAEINEHWKAPENL